MTQDDQAGTGALAGVRVIEFTQILAGPLCGRVLAEMGADVIRIEPPEGDPRRNQGGVVPNESKYFQAFNVGKRSIVIDLSSKAGQAAAQRIAQHADVVVCNYRHGVSQRLGVDYETLSKLNPTLIYCRITGFGVRSVAATYGAVNGVVEAYGGLLIGGGRVGENGLPQNNSGTAFTDHAAGFSATIAICGALYARRETGKGQLIDCSLLRSVLSVQSQQVMREPVEDASQRDPMVHTIQKIREQGGGYKQMLDARKSFISARGLNVYQGAYQASDGRLIVIGASTNRTRSAARRALGISDDPILTPPIEDVEAPEYVAALLQLRSQFTEAIKARPSTELIEVLNKAGCPTALVNFPEEMSDDPIVAAEGIMVPLVHPTTGPQRVHGPLFEMFGTPTRVQGPSPRLGEHSREVLMEAGFDPGEVSTLVDDGAVIQG